MKLIIFGAGASYGSDYKAPLPPLGDKLLDVLVNFAPNAWGRLPDKYKEACRIDFEQGMHLLSEEMPHSLPPLQRAMAAYFFNFQPQITNLYLRLGNLIKSSNWNMKGSLVTFNYERLLEISLLQQRLQPIVGNEQHEPNQIELCLPHGCCHIFCDSVRGSAGAISFSGTNISTNGIIRVIPNYIEFNRRIVSDAFPPVMSYFEPRKRTTSGKSFIDNQRKRYEKLVQDSTKIGIIGLKVRENDTHVWNPLANTETEIVYCAGKMAATEFNSWTKKNREGKGDVILDGYFADCFETICSELGIL